MSNQSPSNKTDEPLTTLLNLASRLTDLELGSARDTPLWLRAFRKNYRHLGATFGLSFEYPNLAEADLRTDKALDDKSEAQAA